MSADTAKATDTAKVEVAQEPVEAPEVTEAEQAPEVSDEAEAPKKAAKGKKLAVVKTTVAGWWCPVCDRAHPHHEPICDGCGYER